MTTPSSPFPPLPWQDDKRLRSGDRVWFLTDIQTSHSTFYNWSVPQQWHRVGGLDLTTMKLGYFLFTTDDVRAILRAGLAAAPWESPPTHGIELTRFYHGGTEEGRFRERISLIDLEPELVAQGPALRAYFERHLSFTGNSTAGMWQKIEDRAAELRAIETAAMSMSGWFAAGDVKALVGEKVNVTPTLALLVDEGRLLPNGKKKRGALYMVSPPQIIERTDWTQ